jgi:hypothetical protein
MKTIVTQFLTKIRGGGFSSRSLHVKSEFEGKSKTECNIAYEISQLIIKIKIKIKIAWTETR